MSNRYPNANYPEAYAEANMVKATDVPVNEDGTGLTVTVVTGDGPLFEHAATGADVRGVTLHDNQPVVSEPSSAPEPAPEPVAEAVEPAAAPESTESTSSSSPSEDDPFLDL